MRVFIESLLLGDLVESKEILNAKLNDLVTESCDQVKLHLAKEMFVDYNLGAFGNRKVAFVLRSN